MSDAARGRRTIRLHADDEATAAWNKQYFQASRRHAWRAHNAFLYARRALIRGLLKASFDVVEFSNVWRIEVRRDDHCYVVDLDEDRMRLDAISVRWVPLHDARAQKLPVYIRDIAAKGKELPESSMAGVRVDSPWDGLVSQIARDVGIHGCWGWDR